jgi:type III pantothenate kinase
MTTICFDFGNTRLKAAIFDNDSMGETIYLENDSVQTIEKIIEQYHPQKTILSSVINHNEAIENVLATKSQFHKLSVTTKINFTTPVGKPETIGADRLALCAAAVHFYPNKNNLIVGLGSCITYNFINQVHEFLGGGISPGMNMRFKSMHDYTALLPLEKETWNFPLIGYDTRTNLQSGVLAGMAAEIEGL